MYRMLAFPPGSPHDAVDALRAAVVKVAADKAYVAEANKLMGRRSTIRHQSQAQGRRPRRGVDQPGTKALMDAYAKRAAE